MKPHTTALFYWMVLALLLVSTLALAQGAQPTRTVNVPVLNMFSAASADTDVVSQAIYGTNVKVLDDKGAWAQIQTPDQYKGWVETAKLTALPHDYAAAAGNGVTPVYVTSMFAHLYREQSVTKHAPMLTVPFETALEATAMPENARWATVRLVDGRTGYVQTGDITTTRQPLTIPEDIALAKRFLGLPYTWGGTSSYGYDCSGFMQMLVRQRGILMPRDADIQAAWTGVTPVTDKAQLQPGDLLYFGGSPQRITHTGMYIGDGLFIDATTHSKPMVQIDNLNDPYWTRLLVAMRRVKP